MTRFAEKDLEIVLLDFLRKRFPKLEIGARLPLPYGAGAAIRQEFKVDILLQDPAPSNDKKPSPRLAIELKAGGVNTHDLLAYSAKANLHRALCGFLRYGIFVAGDSSRGVTAKWLWHGHEFDFMFGCKNDRPSPAELRKLEEIVAYEVGISRQLERWVNQKRGPYPSPLWRKATIG